MLYVFFGLDEFSCAESLRELERDYWPDPTLADLNRTVLDGRTATLAEMRHHCDAVPFLAERRLVIVENLVTRLEARKRGREQAAEGQDETQQSSSTPAKALLEELLSYLPTLPPTTDLVLLDSGLASRDSSGRVVRWARSNKAHAVVREHGKKTEGELARWIGQRARSMGTQIDGRAVAELVQLIGDDLRALANEIDKLALYVSEGAPITVDAVRQLVAHSQEAGIFNIVDAISNRQWERAVAELRQIFQDGAHPLYVLTMINWQYRLIAQAHALMDEQLPPARLAKRLRIAEYPAKKAQALARLYTRSQIEDAYSRLLETDLAIKTGQLEGQLAIEIFVAEQAGLHAP